jgi:hypothetical protein
LVSQRARLLLGSYRKIEADDPKIFIATLAAILAKYSDDVIMAVTDPAGPYRLGWKFPPDPPEIRAACEAEMVPRRAAAYKAAEARVEAFHEAERRRWGPCPIREEDIRRLEDCAAELRRHGDPQRRVPNTMTREQAEAKLEAAILAAKEPLSPKLAADLKRLMAMPSMRTPPTEHDEALRE